MERLLQCGSILESSSIDLIGKSLSFRRVNGWSVCYKKASFLR